ncbi:MAG: sensor histidine kinase [Cellulosilyticaceae bacterium]
MRKHRIANKVFAMMIGAFGILFILQVIFQSLYLENYYIHTKKRGLTGTLVTLGKELADQKDLPIEKKLLEYSEEMGAATAILDLYGAPKYGLDTQRSFIELKGKDGQSYLVYTDSFMNNEETLSRFSEGQTVEVLGYETLVGDIRQIYPEKIKVGTGEEAEVISLPVAINKVVRNPDTEGLVASVTTTSLSVLSETKGSFRTIVGEVKQVYIPGEKTYGNAYRESRLLQETNSLVLDVLQGNQKLYLNEPIVYEVKDSYIGIDHLVGILPMMLQGEPVLLVSMNSLQGVSEASEVMLQYTILILLLVFGIALVGAYWYAKRLTDPLVKLRNITTNIAELDFSQTCEVVRQDEVGELAENINKMAVKLKENVDQLREDIALKEQLEMQRKQLIADVSHELKTPLTVMKGTCCGMMDGIYDVNDRAYFEGMLGQINQMSELVGELLEVSRLENEVVLNQEPFILSDVIYKVHQGLKPLINEKALHITFELEEYWVEGDRKKIETVIRNLYNNAIFYTPKQHEIRLKIVADKHVIRFEITNTGTQIPLELQEKLWEPFYRIDQSRNKALGGSGLGLYIVKQIMERHGQLYGVESRENEVTFWFELLVIRED